MNAAVSFPPGFLWGTATAAHQVEGNNVHNDIWLLEHIQESPFFEPSGDACDHYHRYGEDIALLAELGFNSYRFSLEWSRIEPEEKCFSRAALDHYRRMLATCHENSIIPMVTFHHFTSPRWLVATGGWEGEDTPEKFARFCHRATEHLGDMMGAACTLNEPNIAPFIATLGFLPPAGQRGEVAWWRAAAEKAGIAPESFAPFQFVATSQSRDTMMAAHHRAVDAIKSCGHDFPVGITLALQEIEAADGGDEQARTLRYELNDQYLEEVRGDDFVGVQTYSRLRIGPEGIMPMEEGAELTQVGFEFYPEALEATIREAVEVAGIPVIVTENGIATVDDTRRKEYVQRALKGVFACIAEGLDVRGYYYWSAFDNFEWTFGYGPHFGLVAIDRETQERAVKPSARWLGEVALRNGLSEQ